MVPERFEEPTAVVETIAWGLRVSCYPREDLFVGWEDVLYWELMIFGVWFIRRHPNLS